MSSGRPNNLKNFFEVSRMVSDFQSKNKQNVFGKNAKWNDTKTTYFDIYIPLALWEELNSPLNSPLFIWSTWFLQNAIEVLMSRTVKWCSYQQRLKYFKIFAINICIYIYSDKNVAFLAAIMLLLNILRGNCIETQIAFIELIWKCNCNLLLYI